MNSSKEYSFDITKSINVSEIKRISPLFVTELATLINETKPVHNLAEYLDVVKQITEIIAHHRDELTVDNPRFTFLMSDIDDEETNFAVTPWGGVNFQVVDKTVQPQVRKKYLLVRQSTSVEGTLGPERHGKKLEKLIVEEGYAIFVSSDPDEWEKGEITLTIGGPGNSFTLNPGNRHGVIGLTNSCAILEIADSSIKSDILPAFAN
jgi:hypothetical protein